MSKRFAAPPRIRRIAATGVQGAQWQACRRYVWRAPGRSRFGLGLPDADYGLNTIWRRPRYVFGIDGLQALHLAMKCADAEFLSSKLKLEWLGQTDDLGMPEFLPPLPSRIKIASKRW